MRYDPNIHKRRSIRLKGYDYSQCGLYFITVCAQNRECLFGEIVNGNMFKNPCGEMIVKWVNEIGNKFEDVRIQSFIVMPNHFHAIIDTVGADLCVCPDRPQGEHATQGEHAGSPLLFGNIDWKDADNVRQQIVLIPAMVSKDKTYQNAMRNADKQEARTESDRVLQAVIFSIMTDNMELFKQYNDNPTFKNGCPIWRSI